MMRYFLMLAIVLISFSAAAEVYQWVDKDGVAHISTTPPSDSVKDVRAVKEEDDLLSSDLVFLGKLYTRESFQAEKESLQGQIRFYKEQCRTAAKKWQRPPENVDAYCDTNAARFQRSYDVLTSDPDRYFYIITERKKSSAWHSQPPSSDPPLYQPWE